jgi:membrane-bound lytic murein transglycosylase B
MTADRQDRRHLAGSRTVRRAVAGAVAVCVLVSCSTSQSLAPEADPERSAGPSSPASARPTPSPSAQPESQGGDGGRGVRALPARPARRSVVLSRQLERAVEVLRDPQAAAADVRRAAEFQQLAVHRLATAGDAVRNRVLARLDARTARATRGLVGAARELLAITDPQPRFPPWRIVAPPPVEELLGYYRRAQRRTGVPWRYLAAIHLVETRMGRIRGTSTAGARGPMQFLPTTWDIYGRGGDIRDPRDAILAAGRLLRAQGAPGDMAEALWHYNPSTSYVRAVREYAETMRRSPAAYQGYWHWRVLYRHERGTFVLPVGYPRVRPVKVSAR